MNNKIKISKEDKQKILKTVRRNETVEIGPVLRGKIFKNLKVYTRKVKHRNKIII